MTAWFGLGHLPMTEEVEEGEFGVEVAKWED